MRRPVAALLAGALGGALFALPLAAPAAATPRLATNSLVVATATGTGQTGTGQTEVVEQEPGEAELEAQQSRIAQLRAQAEQQAAQIEDVEKAATAAAELAGHALEASVTAERRLRELRRTEELNRELLTVADQRLRHSRAELGTWVRQAYRGGSALAGDPTLNALLTADSGSGLGRSLGVLRRIGRERQVAALEVEAERRRAQEATDAAVAATEEAGQAAMEADDARQAADEAVDRQRRLVEAAQFDLAGTVEAIQAGETRIAQLGGDPAPPRFPTRPGRRTTNKVTGPTGSCTGGLMVEQYDNGRIPVAALCRLESAPGHYLRADAAYAFDQMSLSYARTFGRPICVTDSYRTYESQVSLYARKPSLAARPGTSNHGWGAATDLCGGIQSFSSAQHRWLKLNGPLFGWFHPGWAEPYGSKPEPWHWEYGG